MLKLCQIALLLILISFCFVSASAQQTIDFSKLREVLQQESKDTATPGAAIVIVKNDRVVFSEATGIANVETNEKLQPQHLFQIGSLTKMLTAAALLTLAEEGKIDLDAPIRNYLKNLNPRIAGITSHQLLSQTSGLNDTAGGDGKQEESALAEFARSLPEAAAIAPPGKFFSYSNPGYAVAGALIEAASGKRYADALRERIFTQLDMTRATLRPTVAMTFPLAVGHQADKYKNTVVVRPFINDTRLWSAGYAFANIEEYSRFVIALLNEGRFGGKQVLSANVVRKMLAPHVSIPSNVFINGSYGYGLILDDYRGFAMAEHAGNSLGFTCELKLILAEKIAVIIFANKNAVRFNKTFEQAFKSMLPLKEMQTAAKPAALVMNAAEMQSLTGIYKNRFEVEIFVRDAKLFLKRFGEELEVRKIGTNRFAVAPQNAPQPQEFTVSPDETGKPKYLQMFVWNFVKL
jgi:CubicO group peptidase (beta-lactamase class C family)